MVISNFIKQYACSIKIGAWALFADNSALLWLYFIPNTCIGNTLQIRREALRSGIAPFTLPDQLRQAVEEEFYPPSVTCNVQFTLPEAERTVQAKLKVILNGAEANFSYDVMEGKYCIYV